MNKYICNIYLSILFKTNLFFKNSLILKKKKEICFHSLIVNFCILMLNQMRLTQDVINTPCGAAYDKSEARKNKFLDHQDAEFIKWNISAHMLWIVGTVSWCLSSATLPCGLVFQWQIWFPNVDWLSEERIKTSVENRRDEHADTSASCLSAGSNTDVLCFAGALLHREDFKEKFAYGNVFPELSTVF